MGANTHRLPEGTDDMARNPDTTPPNAQPRNDAYTGMLIVSLIALLLGGVLLFLDYSQYPDKKAPNVAKVQPEQGFGDQGDGAVKEKTKETPKKK
jgi:hypothetical protein